MEVWKRDTERNVATGARTEGETNRHHSLLTGRRGYRTTHITYLLEACIRVTDSRGHSATGLTTQFRAVYDAGTHVAVSRTCRRTHGEAGYANTRVPNVGTAKPIPPPQEFPDSPCVLSRSAQRAVGMRCTKTKRARGRVNAQSESYDSDASFEEGRATLPTAGAEGVGEAM